MNFVRCHESFEIPRLGVLPPRAYYIPFPEVSAPDTPRENSPQLHLLSGEWDFAYYRTFESFLAGFEQNRLDFSRKIRVPGCWQTELLNDPEIDKPNYVNVKYPFPFDPPFVPEENPIGVYSREFDLSDISGKNYCQPVTNV